MKLLSVLMILVLGSVCFAGPLKDTMEKYAKYDNNLYLLSDSEYTNYNNFLGKYFEEQKRQTVSDMVTVIEKSSDKTKIMDQAADYLGKQAKTGTWAVDLAYELSQALENKGIPASVIASSVSLNNYSENIEKTISKTAQLHPRGISIYDMLYFDKNEQNNLMSLYVAVDPDADPFASRDASRGAFRPQVLKIFNKGEISFTFDDGPNTAGLTETILDAFRQYGYHATFFELGSTLRENDAKIKMLTTLIKNDGHNVGVHGWYHATKAGKPFTAMTHDAIKADLEKAAERITKVYGEKPVVFRAPYGEFRHSEDDILAELGLTYTGWDIDTNDWRKKTPEALAQETIDLIKRYGKGIVLMHDVQARTSLAIGKILKWVNENGYKVVTVKQKLKENNML